jgi:hypothetical protein
MEKTDAQILLARVGFVPKADIRRAVNSKVAAAHCPWCKIGLFALLKELFFPYEPHDYAKIVSREWRRGTPS